MSFNIKYDESSTFDFLPGVGVDEERQWDNRKKIVIDIIEEEDPDVVGLQEVLSNQMEDLMSELSDYGCLGVGRDIDESEMNNFLNGNPDCVKFDGNDDGEFSPILFLKDRFEVEEFGVFWFSGTPDVPSKWSSMGASHRRICTWARFTEESDDVARSFYFFNLHLENGKDKADVRQQSSILLIDRIRARSENAAPVVLAGDLNAQESEHFTISWITGKEITLANCNIVSNNTPLTDTWRIRYPAGHPREGTSHGWSGDETRKRIDYIFVSPSSTVDDAQIIHTSSNGVFPSDHFPITADVYLPL